MENEIEVLKLAGRFPARVKGLLRSKPGGARCCNDYSECDFCTEYIALLGGKYFLV